MRRRVKKWHHTTPPGKCNVEGCQNQATWMVTFGDRTKAGPVTGLFWYVLCEDHKATERSSLDYIPNELCQEPDRTGRYASLEWLEVDRQ
jgi:hypothetical protein